MRIGERGALYLVRYKIRIVGGQDPLYKSSDVEKRKVEKEDPIRRKLFSFSLFLRICVCFSFGFPGFRFQTLKFKVLFGSWKRFLLFFLCSLCLIKPTKGKREGCACWELGIYREMEG